MIGRIIVGLFGIPVGIFVMVKAHKIVDLTLGPVSFAEKYLGDGGTYTMFRLGGLLIAVVALLYMIGVFGTL